MSNEMALTTEPKEIGRALGLTESGMRELEEKWNVVIDASTKEGYELVSSGLKKLTKVRTSLDKRRLAETKPHRDYTAAVNTFAKGLEGRLLKLEAPLKAEKERVDKIAEERERARLATLQKKIAAISAHAEEARGKSSEEIAAILEKVADIDPSEDFFDLKNEAIAAWSTTLDKLSEMLSQAIEDEKRAEEQKRLEEERRQLEAEKAAQEARHREVEEENARLRQQIAEQEAASKEEGQDEYAPVGTDNEMHTSFSPNQIDEDYIENICEDLRCALVNLLENPGDQDEYDNAVNVMRHIDATLNAMMPDDD